MLAVSTISLFLEFTKLIVINALKDTHTYINGKKWNRLMVRTLNGLMAFVLIGIWIATKSEELFYPVNILLTSHKHGIVKNSGIPNGENK